MKWFNRLAEVVVLSLTIAAVCQELEKPKEERIWCGKVAGLVPYDFRLPTVARLKESFWNPADSQVFTPRAFGVGWSINVYALLEKLRIIGETYLSEEDFLMPSQQMKDLLADQSETNRT